MAEKLLVVFFFFVLGWGGGGGGSVIIGTEVAASECLSDHCTLRGDGGGTLGSVICSPYSAFQSTVLNTESPIIIACKES